jgi:hypothetical protein
MLQAIVRITQRAESRSLCRTQSIIFSGADGAEKAGGLVFNQCPLGDHQGVSQGPIFRRELVLPYPAPGGLG